jgi:peptide deformylase
LEAWPYSEGCLSIPKLHGNVIRPWRITVQATDLEGNDFVEDFEGLQARCIMHENDHINGVLYIDRMTPASRKEFEPVLREIKKKYSHK